MYDSPEELLAKIRLGEDTSLELKTVGFRGQKVSEPRRNDLADEIAAIANTADGVLILGVDDRTKGIQGIPMEQMDAVEHFVFEICNDTIKPAVAFRTLRIELPDQSGVLRPILKVTIPRSLFIHKSPGGYFHRQGSSRRELSTEALLRLGQQRSQARLIRFDEQPVPDTGIEHLDERRWSLLVSLTGQHARAVLRKMRLLTDDDRGVERATVAGILTCSRNPQDWLPSAFVQAVRYRGVRQDSNYQIDAQDIYGPLDAQVRDGVAFVRRNMTVAARKDPARMEFPQYSIRAVFEAIVNAVAHRDYSVHGSKIRLFMFDDRLELYSPGALPNTLTVDSLELRQVTRNELITTMLAKHPVADPTGALNRRFLMEKRGDGVPIIMAESASLGAPTPTYRLIDDAELLLTLWAAPTPDALTQGAQQT